MEVKIQTKEGTDVVHPDFQFLLPLVEKLNKNAGPSIYFPKTEGGLREAEAVCVTEYYSCRLTGTVKPAGVFTFLSKRLEMRMMYVARICLTQVKGKPGLQLTLVPTGKANPKVWRASTSQHASYACMVKALSKNFEIGSAFRKIVPLPTVVK
jgi:hypothetical protein